MLQGLLSALVGALGLDFSSPAATRQSFEQLGIDPNTVTFLQSEIPKIAKTIEAFDDRMKRIENMQVTILRLLNGGTNERNGTGTDDAGRQLAIGHASGNAVAHGDATE
jgi:hypothetical protein